MANETRDLAQFAFNLRSGKLPSEVERRLKCLALDNLAAGLIGVRQPWFDMVLDVMEELGGTAQSHVFGSEGGFDCSRATLINGVAIGGFEADHAYGSSHPSGTVFPSVLALAESKGLSGETFLRAMAAGYEVAGRVGRAQTNLAEKERGFHNPGLSGVFGSAAGCSLLLELSGEQTLNAIGISGSSAAGLIEYVWTGAMTKRLHLGRSSQMGLEAALLAQRGFTGPPTVLEGEYGFLQAYSPEPIVSALVDSLGSKWVFEQVRVKPYPTHGGSQPFIPVLGNWRAENGDPSAITAMTVKTSAESTEERFLDPAPTTVLGAQYSLPFSLSIVLFRGVEGLIELNDDVFSDKEIVDFARRIVVETDPRFEGIAMAAGGELIIEAGGSTQVIPAAGLAVPDLDELWALCTTKFERAAKNVITDDRVLQVETMVENLEALNDVRELTKLVLGSRLA